MRIGLALQVAKALHLVAAWVVDDTVFPKKGSHTVGVARQYSGTMGKIGNCQVAVSLHYATDDGAAPLDFTLYLPEEWLEEKRRREAGIPEEVTFQPKWALALVDRALAWEVPRGVISADAGYGNITEFRTGLAKRKLLFVVGIQNTTTVWTEPVKLVVPPRGRRGRPRTKPLEVGAPLSVSEVSRSWPNERWQHVNWREGTKGPMTSRFAAARVLLSHSYQHGGPKEEVLWASGGMAGRGSSPQQILAGRLARGRQYPQLDTPGQDPLVDRARLPATQR